MNPRLHPPPRRAKLHIDRLDATPAPGAVLDALRGEPQLAVLESSAVHPSLGRYSLFACRPTEVLTLSGGRLRDAAGNVLLETRDTPDERFWDRLDAALSGVRCEGHPDMPYAPGWIGYLGYEVGRLAERLPARAPRDTALPDLHLAFHDALLVYDAVERRWSLAVLENPAAESADRSLAAGVLRDAVTAAAHECVTNTRQSQPGGSAHAAPQTPRHLPAEPNFSPADYRRAVGRCVDYIAAGDIFQVNLSQRFRLPNAPSAMALYRALRRRNPACYGGLLRFSIDGRPCALASSSPELFLRLRGRSVLTRPIKGTRPRIGDDATDRAAAADLLSSPKDNAELAMIVDLLRNDLGRVCEYGSVRVTQPRTLETHPTVLHLVASVEGRLRSDVGPGSLLRATFPGGSITGAPKIRAMEIIDELEPVARGPYTGCIGIVCANGNAEWNIAIRTAVLDGEEAYVQVGGGIVADSTPAGEHAETLDKARALLEAFALAGRDVFSPPR